MRRLGVTEMGIQSRVEKTSLAKRWSRSRENMFLHENIVEVLDSLVVENEERLPMQFDMHALRLEDGSPEKGRNGSVDERGRRRSYS